MKLKTKLRLNTMSPGISRNFIENLYQIAFFTGRGITDIELSAEVGSGYCSMCASRDSSPSLRIAERFCKAVGCKLEDLIKDPKQFREEVLKL